VYNSREDFMIAENRATATLKRSAAGPQMPPFWLLAPRPLRLQSALSQALFGGWSHVMSRTTSPLENPAAVQNQSPPPPHVRTTAARPRGASRSLAREQFIPLRKADLVEKLARSADLSTTESEAFRRFCLLLQALMHCDYQTTLEELKNAYAPFDPDADTHPGDELSAARLEERRQLLFERFGWLLERGNFVRLAQEEIDRALADCSQWGLNLTVDFKIFERLELYCRGDVMGTRYRRRLRNRFRTEAVEVPIYKRLVVILCLRPTEGVAKLDTRDVYIKLFKDIPKVDLEMLLPGTRVRMSLFDRAKILLPTLSGISMAVWKMGFPTAISWAFLGLVGGSLGYGVRSFFGYLNTKQKYQLNLTQSLYFQNLDNNAGAIYRLIDEAEEQENREAMLAYFYLWRYAPPAGWTAEQLDERIEAFLRVEAAQDVDFEVGDALAKLERLKIIEPGPEGAWKPLAIEPALATLERRWSTPPA
jgi:hypothetical protein